MPDRNELIASLEGRIWGGEMHKGGYIHVPQEEAEAILELLKEQEPRVLTFDELMALPHMIEDNVPVVSEVKYPVGTWNKGTLCKWRGAEFLQEMVQDHKWYNKEHYGKIWRVWTALPSIKQRKAVKWDE